jgi:hypothetical protein
VGVVEKGHVVRSAFSFKRMTSPGANLSAVSREPAGGDGDIEPDDQ